MAGDYGWKTIVRSAKADFLSLTFFEIGLFGWMAIFDLLIFDRKLGMSTVTYWFMMQVGNILVLILHDETVLTYRVSDRHVLWTLDWIPDQLVVNQ